jgi:ADP-ribosylglycohydrolase
MSRTTPTLITSTHIVGPAPRDIYFGVVGLCIGDALGVPVEFTSRNDLDKYPLDDMVGYGTHGKPPGTWSDNTAMALALADSLAAGKIDYYDIMGRFARWPDEGEYTAAGEIFRQAPPARLEARGGDRQRALL